MDANAMRRELRRNENTMTVAGLGAIAFSVWTVVKAILGLTLHTREMEDLLSKIEITESTEALDLMAAYIAIGIILAFDLALRLYVGLSARKDGFGGRKSIAYIVVVCIMITVNVVTDIAYIDSFKINPDEIIEGVVNALVELTSTLTLIELAYSSIKARVLRKKLAEEAA